MNMYHRIWINQRVGLLTLRTTGPTWEVRSCLLGPPTRNSLLGVIIQNPTGGSSAIHPCTLLSLSSHEYWYLSSTCTSHCHGTFRQRTQGTRLTKKFTEPAMIIPQQRLASDNHACHFSTIYGWHIREIKDEIIVTSPLSSGFIGLVRRTASG